MTTQLPIKVLLVEDDPGDALLVREALADDERVDEISVASDGVYALEQLNDSRLPLPDLILLDLNLPRMDGRELLAEIKREPRFAPIPVVVLTTSDAESDVMRSYELHANAFVTKPRDLNRFLSVVREIDRFFVSIAKLPGRATA
ncbi:MAG TPA: response regulator [Solirubrobacteraceae bacterium]|nr:response regulator [Solirubrobacteraceae bacterium]